MDGGIANAGGGRMSGGALQGVRVIELAGIGPGPFAAMMLADHGAEVIRIERPGTAVDATDVLARSRAVLRLDLKTREGVARVRELAATAHGFIEGFRPGVTERLGLGPDVLLADNPRLVYGRMTGWGQCGPMAMAAGHDINYVALSGTLHALGRAGQKPTPPINLVGDFGGGGMLLAFGMLAGILAAGRTGCGQIVDCAMVDGAALLMSMIWGFRAKGLWQGGRGENYLDTGAPYYDVYQTSDGKFISIGSIEPQFYRRLLDAAGLAEDPTFAQQDRPELAVAQRDKLASIFKSRTRQAWCELMEGTDVCFAPVLEFDEAPAHPHNSSRQTFMEIAGVMQPAPAPRFSATPAPSPRPPGSTIVS